MAVQPVVDHGQELATPQGHAIGFVDTKEQFDAVTTTRQPIALNADKFHGVNLFVAVGHSPSTLESKMRTRKMCYDTLNYPQWHEHCTHIVEPR